MKGRNNRSPSPNLPSRKSAVYSRSPMNNVGRRVSALLDNEKNKSPNKPESLLFDVDLSKREMDSLGITENQLIFYQEVFSMFDSQKIGLLSPNDLRVAIETIGYHPKRTTIYQLISEIDDKELGGITFWNFIKLVSGHGRKCDEDTKEDFERVFDMYDKDSKGFVDREDIKRLALDCGETLDEAEIDEILRSVTKGQDSKCTFFQFQEALLRSVKK